MGGCTDAQRKDKIHAPEASVEHASRKRRDDDVDEAGVSSGRSRRRRTHSYASLFPCGNAQVRRERRRERHLRLLTKESADAACKEKKKKTKRSPGSEQQWAE